MIYRRVLLPLLLFAPIVASAAPHAPVPAVQAARAGGTIDVDGRLDEPAWQAAVPAGDFRQLEPAEGAPATERTELRIALRRRCAVRRGRGSTTASPDQIVRRRSRRDTAGEADGFSLFIDPNHDHLTAVEFRVSAAGVQRDVYVYNDVTEDPSWDAVWGSAVSVDAEGWIVEMRIPFSQLRFPRTEHPTWGINAERLVFRKHEWSWLALVPRNESALASRMAHLEGIADLRPPRHLELRPTSTARAEYLAPHAPGDPFNDGSRCVGGARRRPAYGGRHQPHAQRHDQPRLRAGRGRPGGGEPLRRSRRSSRRSARSSSRARSIFATSARSGANDYWGFNWPEPDFFYSRRIGRAPQGRSRRLRRPPGRPRSSGRPSSRAARAAAGRCRLDAVTAREDGRTSVRGWFDRTVDVEPLTNYFAGRAFKELGSRAGDRASSARPRTATSTAPPSTHAGGSRLGRRAWTATVHRLASGNG